MNIKAYLRRINTGVAAISGAVCAAGSFIVRMICGSPEQTLYVFGLNLRIPPTWLLSILWLAWHFLIGFALGAAITSSTEKSDIFKGGMFSLSAIGIGYLWYPCFFCARLPFFSLIILSIVLFCSFCAFLCWRRPCPLPSVIMIAYCVWLLYMLILNFIAVL